MSSPAAHVDPSVLAFSSPIGRPWHFTALELVVLACFALTVRHAALEWRRGARHHAFQWMVIFVYGLMMELIAFNFLQSYDHAIFTVELYHRQLPLYIPCLYIVLHYTGLEMVQRLRLGAFHEALVSGLAICLLDVPFDMTGASLGWWVWRDGDPNLAFRWLGVPITSYYWYLLFGAVLSLLVRVVRARLETRSLAILALFSPLVAIGVVVLGTVGFLPFHALKALGVRDDVVVIAHLTGATALALGARAPDATPMPPPLYAIVIALGGFDLVALASSVATGETSRADAKLSMSLAAALASIVLAQRAQAVAIFRALR